MGALAHHFHIRPWEIELLSLADFNQLCAQIDAKDQE